MAPLLMIAASATLFIPLLAYCLLALWDLAKSRKWAHIPGPSVVAPLGYVGLGSQPHLRAAQYCAKYGPVCRLRLGREHAVAVTDPVLVAGVLGAGADGLHDKFEDLYAAWPFLGAKKTAFLSSGANPDWRFMRGKLQHPFSISNMRQAFPGIVGCTKQLVDFVEGAAEGQELEMDTLFRHYSLSVMLRVFFNTGIDVDKYKGELSRHMTRAVGDMKWPASGVPGPDSSDSFAWLTDFFHFMAQLTQSKAVEPGEESRQLWAALASVKGMDVDALQAHIGFLLVAGHESVAAAIGWSLYCLATHPNWQVKVARELQAARIGEKWDAESLEYSDVMGLRVLYKVVLEAMRLYPANPTGTLRKLNQDRQVGKHLLPKGTALWVPTYAVHRSAANWDAPAAFDPARWDAENASEGRRGGKRYIPFGSGPRACLGQALAMAEVQTALAALLAKSAFRLASGMSSNGDEVATFRGTLGFQGGLRMVAGRRGDKA
eukprot:evm.model.scf_299.5 EVM.evm.TU.scf_299.5   scf_299:47567-52179(-)